MKKFILFLLIFCFTSNYQLFAQQKKHIQVVVKSGGNHEIKNCIPPNENGKITLDAGEIYVAAHNYQEAIDDGCEPLKLIIRDAIDKTIIYASHTFTPEVSSLPENHEITLCPKTYSEFLPNISFDVPAPCGSDNKGVIQLEYVVNYNYDSDCAKRLLFPEKCYPDDGHNHAIEYKYAVKRTIEYTCCNDDAPPPGDDPNNPVLRKATTASNTLDINLSPNPVQDQLTIEWNASEEGIVQFTIYDSNNRRVYTQQETQGLGKNQYLFDTSKLQDGFYYLSAKSGEQSIIKRLVKIQ